MTARITSAMIEEYTARGYWGTRLMSTYLERAARETPSKIALVHRGRRISYAELQGTVTRVAAGLRALGLGRGDAIGIQLPNWIEFSYFHLAVTRIGAISNPLLPSLRAHEIEYMARHARTSALVVPASYRGFAHPRMVEEVRARLPDLRHVFVVGGQGGKDTIGVEEFLQRPWERDATPLPELAGDANDPRLLLFTTGTEASPKGVLHSHNTLHFALTTFARGFGCAADDVVLLPSPVGHATGAVYGHDLGMLLGGKIVLQDQWNAEEAVELIEREGCTVMWGATAFLHDLAHAENVGRHDVRSLRLFASGGAPIPRDLVRQAQDVIGCRVAAAYGSSEGMNVTINGPEDPLEKVVGTDGRPNPGIDVRLTDDAGRPVAQGAPGEITYRGPNVFLGYLADPERTAAAFDADGFFHSGDLGVLDPDGYLRVVGRKKDIIIRGGENISPAEIENLLYAHPGVREVAVVGMPDSRLGERVCAFVVPRDDGAPTLHELCDFLVARRVAKFKLPERVEIVGELPKTPTGKVRKHLLRDAIAEQVGESR
jgi:acyl-CoA synthetase (AMP-forming)/AMP-acid ligase II